MWLRPRCRVTFRSGSISGQPPYRPSGSTRWELTNINGASTIHGSVSKPLFSAGTITVTAFRVVVTGTYGDTIMLGAGQIRYHKAAIGGTDTALNATQYKILISAPTTLCSSTTSTNFAAEFGGTFGNGVGRNRSTPPTFLIPGYTYLPNSGTTPSINDGYYAIVNNTSPTSSTYPNANRQPTCGGGYGCAGLRQPGIRRLLVYRRRPYRHDNGSGQPSARFHDRCGLYAGR